MTPDAPGGPPRHAAPRRAGLSVQHAYDTLMDSILVGAFAPGARLPDSVLAEQLGLSRAPVREALRLLHQEGLVNKEPNRSYRLAEFTDADLTELAAIRISLEACSIRALIHLSIDLSPIEARLEEIRLAVDRSTRADIVRADLDFHTAIVETSGLRRLISTYRTTRNQTLIGLLTAMAHGHWPGGQRSYEVHREILNAIREAQESGDPRHAVELLESHVHEGRAAQIIGAPSQVAPAPNPPDATHP